MEKQNIKKKEAQLQKIEETVKKNNLFTMAKWLFKPLRKENLFLDIWITKKQITLIMTEEDAKDPQKKNAIYKKLWISLDQGIKTINAWWNFHKNVFDLLTKKISIDVVILLLDSLWNKYKFNMSYIDDIVMDLDIPNGLKQDVLKQKSILAIEKYDFPKKKEIISKIKVLSDKRSLKEKWLGFLELSWELKKEQELKKEIKSWLLMPWFVFAIWLFLIVLVNEKLFPIFIKSFWANNPWVIKKITSNIVYQSYHFVKYNYIILIVMLIILAIAIIILKNINVVRYYFNAFLLKLPIIKDVIKYNELLKLMNILIWQYKYKLWFDVLYKNLQDNTNYYYSKKYYSYDKIHEIDKIIKRIIKDWNLPKQESWTLETLLSWAWWYSNIDDIMELKQDVIKNYKKTIDTLLKLIKAILFILMALMTLLVVKAVYISMYDIYDQIN